MTMTTIAPRRPSLDSLRPGTRGRIAHVGRDRTGRAERLAVLGVTAGATIRVLQTFPGIVFECDQTEMAVERDVARAVLIDVDVCTAAGFPAANSRSSRVFSGVIGLFRGL